MDKSLIIAVILWPLVALGQTHTFPGNNVFPSTSTTDFNAGATVDFTGATVTGLSSGTDTKWDTSTGLTGSGTQAQGRTALGATTAGNALFTLASPGTTSWIKLGLGGIVNVEDTATTRASLGLVPGTNVEVPLTFSTGLTRSTNTVTVNTSQNIATLSNLTTNGFVKTGGAVGTLSVDTATYQASDADLTSWAAITRASGIDTWVTTPSSANLRGALTDENGTGAALFSGATSPDFTTGFTIGAAAGTGKVVIGDGTKFAGSSYTEAAPGTSGNMMVSDGTNWTSKPAMLFNVDTTTVAGALVVGNADTYLPGSLITISAGSITVGTTYRALVYFSKTGVGTNWGPLTLRLGTAGTTSDATAATVAAVQTGTAVIDTGSAEVFATFTAVGASAQVRYLTNLSHNLVTTGLFNTSGSNTAFGTAAQSSSFSSTTGTKIGLSYNGGTSAAHTVFVLKAELFRP